MAGQATLTPLIPFQGTTNAVSSPTLVAADHSLLELDSELDALLDQIQDEIEEQGEASAEAMERFQLFCQATGYKDRSDRQVSQDHGDTYRILQEGVGKVCRSCQEGAEQDRTNRIHSPLLPCQPRPQEDRES